MAEQATNTTEQQWSSHERVQAEYLKALEMWDEVEPARPNQMDLYDSSVTVRLVIKSN